MALKIFVFAAFLAVASAAAVPTTTEAYEAQESAESKIVLPVIAKEKVPLKTVTPLVAKPASSEYDSNPQYSYSYDIQDGLTGDNKQHQETRNGDVVEGSYSLLEADGSRRTVHYTADSVHGFNAVVDKQAPSGQPKPVAPVAPKLVTKAPNQVVKVGPLVHQHVPQYVVPQHAAPPVIAHHHNAAHPIGYEYSAPLGAPSGHPFAYGAPIYNSYAAPAIQKVHAPAVSYPGYAPYGYENYAVPSYPQHVTYANYNAPIAAKLAPAPVAYHGYAPEGYNGYVPNGYVHQEPLGYYQ